MNSPSVRNPTGSVDIPLRKMMFGGVGAGFGFGF
jgi:hypothetical protein